MPLVQDICTRAALMLGAVQNGEALETQELSVIQATLNAFLDSESIQRDSIYRVSSPTRYALTPGTQDYTFGSGGSLSSTRPDFISGINLVTSGSGATEQTSPLRLLEDSDWETLGLRKYASVWPTGYHVDYSFPTLKMSLYPVPTAALSIDVYVGDALPATVNLSDTFILPKGYERFIVSNLALEIQPMFPGTQISPQLMKIADDSRNAVRFNNRKEPPRLYASRLLTGERGPLTDIRVDSMR